MNLSDDAANWETSDGSLVEIRPIRRDDEPLLLDLLADPSAERLRPPSFGGANVLSRDCFLRLCRLESDRDVGFVADWKDGEGVAHLVGVSRLFIDHDNISAELALEVVQAWEGKGLSGGLIQPLIAIARKRGVRRIVTGAQGPMMSIATGYGFLMNMRAIGSDGTFEVVRDLARGIDLSKYDASRISKADVKVLVSSMYTGADAKEEIKHFFLDVDPGHAAQCLDELFHGPDPEVKSDAVELLVFLKGAESLPWIEKCLTDVDVGFRCAGCSFLAELDCPEAVPRLLRCLREDPSDWVRYAAVDALECQGDTAALPALRQTAKNDKGTDYEGRLIKDRAREAIRRITSRKR